jgi:hypothetical protein
MASVEHVAKLRRVAWGKRKKSLGRIGHFRCCKRSRASVAYSEIFEICGRIGGYR